MPFSKICGIICEYNPFHNGHHLQLTQLRRDGGAAISVLSGSFVQRGEPAIVARSARVAAALRGGADLVLELPAVWACAGAERFASAGIAILNGLGCVDELWYGSEHPDADRHLHVARLLDTPAFTHALRTHLATGCTFAAARSAATAQLTDAATAELLASPNDTLGIEYCKAILHQHSPIHPHPILREAAPHDSTVTRSGIASASLIRAHLRAGQVPEELLPAETVPLLRQVLAGQGGPSDASLLTRAVLARLRSITPEEAALLPDISEGLERRLLQSARTAATLEELYDTCKTRRYTHARIRRLVWAAMLTITEADQSALPPYIRVLGLTGRGRQILNRAKTTATLPIVTRPGEIRHLSSFARRVFQLECIADDLWGLSVPSIQPCGRTFTDPVIFVP
ncbi:MAG: nucleotidyltransferase family protein [Clostridia bacterium]|nr:nucleotidyltransferase family protein [Clostridia bacterium]